MEINEKSYEILDNFKNKHIAVIGDIMLDKYIFGRVDRISPEAPVQVVNVKSEKYILGGAGNVCNNLSSLGCRAELCGVIGEDEGGNILLECISERKMGRDGIFYDRSKRTTQKMRVVSQGQQLIRIDYEDPYYINSDMEERITEYFENHIHNLDLIIVSDYIKGVVTKNIMEVLINLSIKNNKKVVIDPKPKHKDFYKKAYLLTPNLKEASAMSGIEYENDEDIRKMGNKLVEEMGANILITCGSKGMFLFKKNGDIYELPTKAREVYDVTGAGDTVIATLSLCLAAGANLMEGAYIANYAAGLVVRKTGTATTTAEEIKMEIKYEQSRISG